LSQGIGSNCEGEADKDEQSVKKENRLRVGDRTRSFSLPLMLQQNKLVVERIDLSSLGRGHARLNVVAADLSRRHKSDDFNSFLMHLFF
jgi:hypothetical protein